MSTNFTTIDGAIVVVYLLAIAATGWFCRRFVRGMAEFVVAGRSVRSYLGVATLIGSELGLITVMYSAQKGFTSGFAVFHIAISAGVASLLIGWTGFIVVPLRRMGVMTIPEFYEHRFGRDVRIIGGLVLAVAGILNMGLFLKAGALFVAGVTGLTDPTTIELIMTAMIVLVLFYTVLGGMLSVVVTDYIQFVVLSIGMLVACGFAVGHLGWDTITTTVHDRLGDAGVDPFHKDNGGLGYVVWMAFLGVVSAAVWQTSVIRACSAKSEQDVRRIYMLGSIGFSIRFLIPYLLGICAFVWFTQAGGDLYQRFVVAPIGDDRLLAMPAFLGQLLPAGLLGLVVAGMLSAFMSTHDTYLLCWSSVLTQDVIAPLHGGELSPKARLTLTRVIIVAIAAFLLYWSLYFPLKDDLWDYMAISGAIYFTGAFAVLAIGLYWQRASSAGAKAAIACGALAVLGLGPIRKELFGNLEAHWVGLGAVAAAVAMMVLFSLLMPDPPRADEGSAA